MISFLDVYLGLIRQTQICYICFFLGSLRIKMLQKSEESTFCEGRRDQTHSENCLLEVISNLQDELTHCKRGLSKADQLIQFYKNENQSLKADNAKLKLLVKEKQDKMLTYSQMLDRTETKTQNLTQDVESLRKNIFEYEGKIQKMSESLAKTCVQKQQKHSIQKQIFYDDLNVSILSTEKKKYRINELEEKSKQNRPYSQARKSENKWVTGEMWKNVKMNRRIPTNITNCEIPSLYSFMK